MNLRKTPLCVAGVVLLIIIAVSLLWYNSLNNSQAIGAMMADVYFDGEYRIGDGEWSEIEDEQHIPATKGDITLKGNFHLLSPDGEYVGIFTGDVPIAFYTDHINLTVCEKGFEPYKLDSENPLSGETVCGATWTAYSLMGDGTEPIELVIHNPHRYGNEMAVDEFLSNIELWGDINFQGKILAIGKVQRIIGWMFIIAAIAILGIALFSVLLRIQMAQIMWLTGLIVLFAGIYIVYSAPGVDFWGGLIINNTAILGLSMILYMFFIVAFINYYLQKIKLIGTITTVILGVFDGVALILPMVTDIYFYDIWYVWMFVQSAANVVMFVCMTKEITFSNKRMVCRYVAMSLTLIAFELDAAATAFGWWQGGLVSKYVFAAMFVVMVFVILKIVPASISATAKARELELQSSRLEAEKNMIEAELKESKIAIMLSQIKPHFIYNTLGTIERMCLKDPEQAFELVRHFSLYLRGNFSELENVTPIRFTEEIKHVEHYVKIEKVRFPDMNIEYALDTVDFVLPALSVQPLVENAIKHGLMGLETGGTIVVRSYETETHFCIEVNDDGIGFDRSLPIDDKKHVGLRNIEGRLKTMVNGELVIESEINVGTKAKIMIPKEVIV
ncbi:MAG: histidine kinase [Parabacteroides sp.]|nr:histidine kinase [Parabacteroides sp.]